MEKKVLISTLWVFLVVNFMFCDIFSLMYSEDLKKILTGNIDGVQMTQHFLLSFAIVMEIPMAMILVSRVLKQKLNRTINLLFAILLAIVQIWSLSVGNVTLHYWFFSIVEIAICVSIFVVSWNWKTERQVAI